MPTQDAIDQQRRRLEAHRATLAHYLDQVSLLGAAYTPPGVGAGIREARAGIAQCKAALHGWGEVALGIVIAQMFAAGRGSGTTSTTTTASTVFVWCLPPLL